MPYALRSDQVDTFVALHGGADLLVASVLPYIMYVERTSSFQPDPRRSDVTQPQAQKWGRESRNAHSALRSWRSFHAKVA